MTFARNRKLLRHKTKYRNIVDISDDSDMEASFDEIIEEEKKRFDILASHSLSDSYFVSKLMLSD
jgi:hypothetical protein